MARRAAARDIDGMNTDTRTLTRSSTDRHVGGVAGGLGAYFGVDPVLFRVGFAAATLLSGVGALAYLALLIFVKPDDEITATPGTPIPA
jgi:phage shock protein PspC (stress-responsive transcriptional regulator)